MTQADSLSQETFPPPGWVDREGAARFFGIASATLATWHRMGRARCWQWVKRPGGGERVKIYPIAELERVREQMAASRPTLPEGYVDWDTARRMFGVCEHVWWRWERAGKIRCAQWGRTPNNNWRKIYPLKELQQLLETRRGATQAYTESTKELHFPEGFVGLRQACRMFGVNRKTFERWECEGRIACGIRSDHRKLKLYPVEALKRLVEECGRYAPPYPDPDQLHVVRVPLAGLDIQRREAIIDAEDLPLIEGMRWHGAIRPDGSAHVRTLSPTGTRRVLAQLVMGVRGMAWRVSHRNGDPLDCRKSNLIVRTPAESGAARHKASTYCGRPCTSRFKGVCWDRRQGKWKAYAKKDRVMRNIGMFDDEIAAAQAHDEVAHELFGEHARLNFPDGVDAALELENAREADREAA
jgi:hypothetical protein